MKTIPRPLIGGSWVYCHHVRRIRGGAETCLKRYRIRRRGLAKYRRHWIRHHSADWALPDTDVRADLAAVGRG